MPAQPASACWNSIHFRTAFSRIARAAAGAVEFADGSAAFGRARAAVDATERALIARADELARDGIAAVDPGALDAGSAVAAAEERIRLGGAEEAYVAIAPDLDADRRFVRLCGRAPLGPRFALRISAAYKGSWVRRIATFARDAEGAAAAALSAAWFDEAIAGFGGEAPLGPQITAAVARLPGAAAVQWMAETCLGSYPLEAIAGEGAATERLPAEGSLVVLSVDLAVGGVPWSGGAPFILGRGGAQPSRRAGKRPFGWARSPECDGQAHRSRPSRTALAETFSAPRSGLPH